MCRPVVRYQLQLVEIWNGFRLSEHRIALVLWFDAQLDAT
jgi:hypothetical protein